MTSCNTNYKTATCKKITAVDIGSSKDVDIAVDAAKKVRVHPQRHGLLLTRAEGIQNGLGFKVPQLTARKAAVQAG
jgi:hypothetical protein